MIDENRVRHLLWMRAKRVGNASKLARKMGVDRTVVHKFLEGARSPTPAILDYMGLERFTAYRYKKRPPGSRQGKFGTIYGDADV